MYLVLMVYWAFANILMIYHFSNLSIFTSLYPPVTTGLIFAHSAHVKIKKVLKVSGH